MPAWPKVLVTSMSAARENTLMVWNPETVDHVVTMIVSKPSGHTTSHIDVAVSPDGLAVLPAVCDSPAQLWSSATGERIAEFVHGSSMHAFVLILKLLADQKYLQISFAAILMPLSDP